MSAYDILGYIGAVLLSTKFLPQVYKTWKTGSAEDVSYGMCVVSSLGSATMLAYGIDIESYQVIMINSCSGLLSSVLFGLKVYQSTKKLPVTRETDIV